MITHSRLPPLPKSKTISASSILKIEKIRTIPRPPLQCIITEMENHRNETSLQHISQEIKSNSSKSKQRPQSCKSTKSLQSRDSSCSIDARRYAQGQSQNSGQMPSISAKSWIVYEIKQNRRLCSKRSEKKRQIASLTKIMNLITILEIVQNLKIDPSRIRAKVSQKISTVNGTTAELKYGAQYTLKDLYYGMMLPSGNDAATMIAEIGSYLLLAGQTKDKETIRNQVISNKSLFVLQLEQGASAHLYLKQMNRMARSLGLYNTYFANPHGLSNTSSHSTASDVAKLCSYAMRNQQFREIVRTQKHGYSFKMQTKANEDQDKQNTDPNKTLEQNRGVWQNTNRMLGEGWSGIKTGITPNAGPCLAASVSKSIYGKQYEFLVVLLKSESMQARWEQVQRLVNWAIDSKLYL